MKKEMLLAILMGITLGFIVTVGIWKARTALQSLPQTNNSSTTSASSTPNPSVSQNTSPTVADSGNIALNISQPEDNSVVKTDKVIITGSSSANAKIVIFHEEGEIYLEADANGKFESEVPLIGGSNEIQVVATDNNGNQKTIELSIVYTTAEI